MAKNEQLKLPLDTFIPEEAHAAIARLNKLSDAEVQLIKPSNANKAGFLVGGENAKLYVPIQFESAIADAAATLPSLQATLNAVLAQFRKSKVNPG